VCKQFHTPTVNQPISNKYIMYIQKQMGSPAKSTACDQKLKNNEKVTKNWHFDTKFPSFDDAPELSQTYTTQFMLQWSSNIRAAAEQNYMPLLDDIPTAVSLSLLPSSTCGALRTTDSSSSPGDW